MMAVLVVMALALPNSAWSQGNDEKTEGNPFDIAILIENRSGFEQAAAKEDVNKLFRMLDQHMLFDKIIILERPTIAVVCDVFGCPDPPESDNPFPPLIWQIARKKEARLLVYYLGEGRIEGVERQLLFKRRSNSGDGDVVPFDVDWLHEKLADAEPKSAVVMLDTSFAPRPLPCANDEPLLISDALLNVRLNFETVMKRHRIPAGHIELSATTPVQVPHCDRLDQVADGVERPLFSKFLLKGIVEEEADKKPFGDQDRLIDLDEAGRFLDDRLKHAARFQWGRLQNVRAVGPGGRVLAAIDPRKLRPENKDVFDRRESPSPPIPMRRPEIEQEPLQSDIIVTGDPISLSDGPSATCEAVANTIAPFATALYEAVGGNRDGSCTWAKDENKPVYSPPAQILTPVAWRIGRTNVQSSLVCLFDCDGLAMTASATLDESETEGVVEAKPSGEDGATTKGFATDPTVLALCGQLESSFPLYIDLPRWMPGTLLAAEFLHDLLRCPPPVELPQSPTPRLRSIRVPPPRLVPPPCDVETEVPVADLHKLLVGATNFVTSVDGKLEPVNREELQKKVNEINDTADPQSRICILREILTKADLSVSEIRWLQSALTVDNRNPGPIDGVIGRGTIDAVNRWRASKDRRPLTEVIQSDFQEIIREFGERFEQVQDVAQFNEET